MRDIDAAGRLSGRWVCFVFSLLCVMWRDCSEQPPKPFLTEDEAPGGTPIDRPPVLDEAAGLAMVFFHIASVFIACAHTFLFRPWNVPGFEAGKDKGRLLAVCISTPYPLRIFLNFNP
jgi:hypothetical protein